MHDFGATIDASRGYDEFNYRTLDEYASMGQESMKTADQPYDEALRALLIRALRVQGRVEVLSRPQVMTLDNQTAYMLAEGNSGGRAMQGVDQEGGGCGVATWVVFWKLEQP